MDRVGDEVGGGEAMEESSSSILSTNLDDYTIITEGEARILMPANSNVYYNEIQISDRDISIAVLRTFTSKRKEEHEAMPSKKKKIVQNVSSGQASKCEEHVEPSRELAIVSKEPIRATDGEGRELLPARVLEALAATGVRAIRYAREVEEIGQVVAIDHDKASVEACKRNVEFNGSAAKVESHRTEARVFMLSHPKEFDVVDIDPYGSPSGFLDSAVQSIADGGMLMCTATDMAVLCGGSQEICYSKYGSYPLRGEYRHEMALRIVLACIESHANRYKRYIVPVLSVQMDFYVRVFVRIFTSASEMKNTPLKLSYVYQCVGCDSFHLQSLATTVSKDNSVRYLPGFGPAVPQECSACGNKFNMGGPIWSAPIHDKKWVASILENVQSLKEKYPTYHRISAVLATVSEELPDAPLFLSLNHLSKTLKYDPPSTVKFRYAVCNAGYRISGTHMNPLGLKSDAPMDVIWDIMRCWIKKNPRPYLVKAQPADQSGTVILAKEPALQNEYGVNACDLTPEEYLKVLFPLDSRRLLMNEDSTIPVSNEDLTLKRPRSDEDQEGSKSDELQGGTGEVKPELKRRKTEDPTIPVSSKDQALKRGRSKEDQEGSNGDEQEGTGEAGPESKRQKTKDEDS
ncbi:hypothetical protein MKW94_007391 [Papaver nudicaule]|uniref:tRNA (guanine(26)-N(2))-dimethyltransferase n=1 Tax=Papaver nudicaule TaxID=74823 RepID=A0AA41SF62_PAPNU|nr:hypothetical protein [Papaver nudicaule]